MSGLNYLCKKWCDKAGCSLCVLDEWKNELLFLICMWIDTLKHKTRILKILLVLEQNPVIRSFVISTKLGCYNTFYAKVLVKELGLNNVNISSPTYVNCIETEEYITNHIQYVNKKDDDTNLLPKMYWAPYWLWPLKNVPSNISLLKT